MVRTTKPKLWHCYNSRSLRALWALEEMGLDYELEVMPFPPRVRQPGYKAINSLGTVPYFTDGAVSLTESSGICLYLVERYQQYEFGLRPDHPEYGDYLNWLFHSDATLTFPQTIFLRYAVLEPEARRQPAVASDYRHWYLTRLRRLEEHIPGRIWLCDERFTIADIAIGYALLLGELLGIGDDYAPALADYLNRLKGRPAFQRCQAISPEANAFRF